MKVIIDGVDHSKLFHKYGMQLQPKKRYGINGDIALSGEKIVDLLATKNVITLTCNSLTTKERDILASTCAKEVVTLLYNPGGSEDEDRTINAEPTMSSAKIKLRFGKDIFWDGAVVTMEEV